VDFISVGLVALAVSLDGFLVGIAYGIKRIRVPLGSLSVITGISMLMILVSMTVGKVISHYASSYWSTVLGTGILLGLGVYYWWEAWRKFLARKHAAAEFVSLNIKPLGLIIHILLEPEQADQDASGEISLREAWLLGFALSMDSLAAGVGLALTGNHVLLTAVMVGWLQFLLVWLGTIGGVYLKGEAVRKAAPFLSGCVFVFLALSRLA
jgi:putative sporulation protein YtaF